MNKVSEINLNCSNSSPKLKWENSIERAKEGNWILYINSSKNDEGRVESGWMSHGGKI